MKLHKAKNFSNERGTSRALSFLFVSILVVAVNGSPAHAEFQLNTAQISVFNAATEGDRVRFLIDRAKGGQGELVEALLKRFPLRGPHAANRALFVRGLILASKGDLTSAAKNYRGVLANDPKLTLVRSELVQTLLRLDETDSAKHHLKMLEADAPSEAVATRIRSFIDKVDAKSPFKFSGFVSLAPSTNVNSGSNHESVYSANTDFSNNPILDISGSKKQSGVGLLAGASIGYSKRLGNKWEAVFAGNVSGSLYADRNYDSVDLSQSLEMRYHLDEGYLGFGAVADQSINPNAQNLIDEGVNYHSYGPRVSLRYNLGQRDTIASSATYEFRKYLNADYLSGAAILTDLSWSHAIDSSLNVSISAGFTKVNANEPMNAYGTVFGGLNIYKEMPLGITVNSNAQVLVTGFDAENGVAGRVRQDQRYIGGITLTKRDLNILGFAPSLNYTYTLNKSNIALWDYDTHSIDFRFTKDF
jgi:outer membrane protein